MSSHVLESVSAASAVEAGVETLIELWVVAMGTLQ